MLRAVFLTASIAALSSANVIAQEERSVAIADVPSPVMDTALATAPGLAFKAINVEYENGEAVYEFAGVDASGKHIEIDVRESGALDEIEMEIELNEAPAAVQAALETTAPGLELSYAEFSVRDNGDYVYEFEGEFDGRSIDIEIMESGEVIVFNNDNLI